MRLLYRERPFHADGISRVERAGILASNIVAFRMRAQRLDLAPHSGGFSLKTVFSGAETYTFEGRRVHVTPGEVLAVAPGHDYASTIRTPTVTDSFAVFFPRPWLTFAARDGAMDAVARMLDDGGASIAVVSPELICALRSLVDSVGEDPGQVLVADEALLSVVNCMVRDVERTHEDAGRVDAASWGTRLELTRRVHRVQEFLRSRLEQGATLARIAEIACLSEFHTLRVFKQVTGLTPSRYLERQRMAHARALLSRHPDMAVSEVASACGYGNMSAFGRAFRRIWNCSPSDVRRSFAKDRDNVLRDFDAARSRN